MVEEGVYTVKMIKGKKTYETKIELLPSLLNTHSAEDRKIQYKTTMTLYDMQEDLAFLADSLENLRKQLESRSENARGRLAKNLEQRSSEILTLYNSIAERGDGLMDRRQRLRNDVVDLYGAVVGYRGRPTDNQLSQTRVLESRVAKARDQYQTVAAIDDLNGQLTRSDLEPLALLDRETWENDRDAGPGGGTPSKAFIKQWYKGLGHQILTPSF
jgi:hypothetical protein